MNNKSKAKAMNKEMLELATKKLAEAAEANDEKLMAYWQRCIDRNPESGK